MLARFEQVLQKMGVQGTLLHASALTGGVSAQVTALEIQGADGQTEQMIVRQHGAVDLKHNSHIAADEFKLLHHVHTAGLPTPRPYFLDESGEIFPNPYLVLEYIEGQPEFSAAHIPDVTFQLAKQLSSIHQVDCTNLAVTLPQQAQRIAELLQAEPRSLDESFDEGRIRSALGAARQLAQRNATVLLHGDYWPGNILWKDGRIVAVIDWEDAALGDPLADVANCRLELLWAFGTDAMDDFTQQYQVLTTIDWTHLPYWDLWADLRLAPRLGEWGLDSSTEQTMRAGHRWFIAQAFEKLARQGAIVHEM